MLAVELDCLVGVTRGGDIVKYVAAVSKSFVDEMKNMSAIYVLFTSKFDFHTSKKRDTKVLFIQNLLRCGTSYYYAQQLPALLQFRCPTFKSPP
jgi:hypothetical protein